MSERIATAPSGSRAELLRNLDESAFFERYACDRFTASVLGNRFHYVLKNMSTKLRSNAFSPIIRNMDDFCITISGPPELGWPMPAASLTNPIHWGPVADSVRIVLEEVGLDALQPNDLIVCNDSYRTGKHLNDTSFIRPMFWDNELIGAVHITAHQLDLGSRIDGGFDSTSQSLWEDGLVLSPQLLYQAGQPQRSAFSLIGANSRYPEMILADLQVLRSVLDLGDQLLQESIARYGIDAFHGAIRYACDAAAEEMSAAIQKLPDGEYFGSEVIDRDGLSESPEYLVNLRINKRGQRMEFDFNGTSVSSRTALNCSWLDVKTGILLALKLLLDRHSSPNSGALRNVDVVLPPGSLVNPHPPTATMFYFSMVQAVIRVTERALSDAVGQDAIGDDTGKNSIHRAWGVTESGEPWGGPTLTAGGGGGGGYGWGATQAGDADSSSLLPWMNFPVTSVEVNERNGLNISMRNEAAPDTGGPGYNRGGAGRLTDSYSKNGGNHHFYMSQVKHPPQGVNGGKASPPTAVWVFDPEVTNLPRGDWLPEDLRGDLYRNTRPMAGLVDPDTKEISTGGAYVNQDEIFTASVGSIFRTISSGGGGWGDPFTRQPERVLRDVRDGYVSVEGAARDYGVAVAGDPKTDPEGLRVDLTATQALRAKTGSDPSKPA
jgi:N-methylhydantoinase B